MITFAVYAYMLPYKEMFVNVVELFFQLCFMTFLLLRSTRSVVNDYLVFPGKNISAGYNSTNCVDETGIAKLTWILFPFACLPLIVITTIFATKVVIVSW